MKLKKTVPAKTKSSGSLNLKEREGHQCQEWAGSDISYVSDTFSKPDRGVFTAEPLKAVWIFCRGVLLGKYICKFRLGLGIL